MASRGLMAILSAIKFKHGNLFSPFEGPIMAKKAYDDLIQVYGNQSQIEIYGADIKEMYTFSPKKKSSKPLEIYWVTWKENQEVIQ